MLRSCGFEILREKATVPPLELVTGFSERNPLMRLANAFSAGLAKIFPTLFGYQFMFVLSPGKTKK